jgi:hypothetical protein
MAVKTKNRMAELESESENESNGRHQQPKQVPLIALEPKRVMLTIYGISPLIVHAWGKKAIGMIEDKQQKKGKKPKEAKDPKEEMESCFYPRIGKKHTIPAAALKGAVVSAATSLDDKINFSQKKIKQAFFVVGDWLQLEASEPVMRTDMVRVGGMSKSADVRYRPMFEKWSCSFAVDYNASIYSAEQVAQLIEVAGFAVGLCEWRPEKGGNFGRFTLKKGGVA